MLVLTPAFQPLENRPFGTIIFATSKYFTKRRYLFLETIFQSALPDLAAKAEQLFLFRLLTSSECPFLNTYASYRCSVNDDFMYKSVCCITWKTLFAELMTFSVYSNGNQLPLRTVYKGHINHWVSWKSLCTGYMVFHASL